MESWDAVLWMLVKIAILSLVVERALYVVFEWLVWKRFEAFTDLKFGIWFDMKPLISIALGIFLAFLVGIDLVSMLFSTAATTAGMIVTGMYIAGGSKAVFLMFERLRTLRDAKAVAQIDKGRAEVELAHLAATGA